MLPGTQRTRANDVQSTQVMAESQNMGKSEHYLKKKKSNIQIDSLTTASTIHCWFR